ncbi:shikimate kinase [Cnuibacter sp. UC19_7]|uniref:shikimate kinase n=1 Tax=Cnuibacter sp. UC19_7 TaxID=3350166 RepID=UPI00366B41CE
MTVVLIGPPASGKSRIGKRIARVLGTAFVDTDSRVAAAHGPIPDIFASQGEPHFRSLERAEVVAALATDAVVAFGGGAVLDPDTQRDLAEHDVVLFTVDPSAVASRLTNGKRPLVPDVESWIRVWERRRDLYQRLADVTFDTTSRPTDEIALQVADWVRGRTVAPLPAPSETPSPRTATNPEERP